MHDLIKGWRAAIKMALEEPTRYSEFNEDNWDIHDKKKREMPVNLKELDKLLWKAFRAGQACTGESIVNTLNTNDWTKYFDEPQSSDT